jgi:hypothetical protein
MVLGAPCSAARHSTCRAGALHVSVAIALGLALIALLLLRWRQLGHARPRLLLALVAIATPIRLVFMGLASDTMPVEIR